MQNSTPDWITTKELARIKGISERAVRKAINSGLSAIEETCF